LAQDSGSGVPPHRRVHGLDASVGCYAEHLLWTRSTVQGEQLSIPDINNLAR
jgi:hypothetical protein